MIDYSRAISFRFGSYPDYITVQARDDELKKWVVVYGFSCLNKDGIFKRDPLPYTEKLFEDCVFDFETAFKLAEQIERIGVLFFVKPDLINDEKTRFNFGVKIDHLLPEDLEYLRKLAEIKISEIKV